MFFNKPFFYLVCFGVLSLRMVLAVDIGTDTTINTNSTERHTFTNDNVTLTNNADIILAGANNTILSNDTQTGITIINNAGATIGITAPRDSAVTFINTTNATLINSGTISSGDGRAVGLTNTTGSVFINNAGGVITAKRSTIKCDSTCTNLTITNSGKIIATGFSAGVGTALLLVTSTGLILTNNAGGEIISNSGDQTIDLQDSGTFTNSGLIRALDTDGKLVLSDAVAVIKFNGTNTTVLLKDKGIVVGTISNSGDNAGSKLQVQHGYGRSYMYQTLGQLELADLSGNRIVKGSATAVGMGAQETVDELLGLRAYNLRATLKRYADLQNPKAAMEPFVYVSHRDGGRTTLDYENYAAGTNFIYPVVPDKLNLILIAERNKLRLDEGHEVTKNSFLIGVNTNDFMEIGEWKASSYAVAGWSWHDSSRDVLTNTVITGIADVSAKYESAEAITGMSFTHSYDQKVSESVNNTWDTDLGLTFSFSHTPSYSESQFFTWEERNLAQLSIHIGEQLTSMLGDKVQFKFGGELEHRSVIAGKNQNHALNAVTVDFNSGAFYENSISMNTSFDYALGQYSKAYIQFNGRASDQTAFSLGGSAGVNIYF